MHVLQKTKTRQVYEYERLVESWHTMVSGYSSHSLVFLGFTIGELVCPCIYLA